MSEQETSIYVHEIQSIAALDGELHLYHEGGTIVFNTTTLFSDLPIITRLVIQEQKIETETILTELKQITDETI